MKEKIKIAVIGCGTWGKVHADIFDKDIYAELIAVCDFDIKKAEELGKKYSIRYYQDYKKMIDNEDIDAVGIATPDYAHQEPIIAAATKGKHILCEKPLVTKFEELEGVIDIINKTKVRIMVDYHNRWNPVFAIAKEKISHGDIGEPINGYMRLNDTIYVPREYIGWADKSSIIWFLGSHTIDTMCWLVNDKVKRVYSVSRADILKSEGINTVDTYLSTLEFEKGVIAQTENGWITPNSNPMLNDLKCNILCTKGMVNIDQSNSNFFEIYNETKKENPDVFIKHWVHGSPKGFSYEAISDFVHKLYFDEEFIVSFEDSVNVNKVLFAILSSAETRQPVEVKY